MGIVTFYSYRKHLLKLGGKTGEYEELRERAYTKLLPNGTLLLQHVKEDREGFYLCQASNGIGTGIGKVVQLKVNCKFSTAISYGHLKPFSFIRPYL